jgi:DtxR family Mn-dependent transcriptional regulator
MLSLAEENYLKSIYHLSRSGSKSVSTNAISDDLKTKPASVSDMIKKLAKKKVISYRKYQGVEITEKGRKAALGIIRKHRLWEVFLVDKLDFHWDEVHEIAEQLEHIKSPLLTQKLDEFLGFPRIDPHGDPIPDEEGNLNVLPKIPLIQMELNQSVMITGVNNSESGFLKHLDKLKISLGTKIKILEKNEFDGSLEIALADGKSAFISDQVAKNLLVSE